jgi:hypothetical protein
MKTSIRKTVIDSKKVNKIDFEKSNFKKSLQGVKERINETKSSKAVDGSKLHYTFSI